MVDVTAHRQREVDHLRLEPDDLAAQQVVRGGIVLAHAAKQLVVALVAAVNGVGQVEKDDRRLAKNAKRSSSSRADSAASAAEKSITSMLP